MGLFRRYRQHSFADGHDVGNFSISFFEGRSNLFPILLSGPYMGSYILRGLLLLCLILPTRVLGALINVTIDDQNGDSVTGNLVSSSSNTEMMCRLDVRELSNGHHRYNTLQQMAFGTKGTTVQAAQRNRRVPQPTMVRRDMVRMARKLTKSAIGGRHLA